MKLTGLILLKNMAATLPPMIVNNTLANHSLIPLLASHFRVILSSNTPADTLQFPSFQCSCLLLDTDIDITLDFVDTCLAFLSSNTNPFILLTPSMSESTSPLKVTNLSNALITQLVPLSMKTPVVMTTWTSSMAMTAMMKLVQPPPAGLSNSLEPALCEGQQADMVRAMTESGLCKDRVDSMLLLSQVGSFNRLARGEGDIPREARMWLEEDRELVG